MKYIAFWSKYVEMTDSVAFRWLTIFTATAGCWLVQRCTTIKWHFWIENHSQCDCFRSMYCVKCETRMRRQMKWRLECVSRHLSALLIFIPYIAWRVRLRSPYMMNDASVCCVSPERCGSPYFLDWLIQWPIAWRICHTNQIIIFMSIFIINIKWHIRCRLIPVFA